MFRTSDIVLITVMVGAAAATYTIKHRAEATVAEMQALDRQIKFEKDTIDILNAEWSLLTQPNRLQALAEKYKEQLGLQELDPMQVGTVEEVPDRPLSVDDILAGQDALVVENDTLADPVTTGGVKP